MLLLKNIKSSLSLLAVTVLLCSCSSAVFPEIIEDDQAGTVKSSQESSALAGDEVNAAYEGGKDAASDKVTAAKTKPVFRGKKVDSDEEEIAEIDDSDFEALLNDDSDDEEEIVVPAMKAAKLTPAAVVEEQVVADNQEPSVTYRLETFYFANGSSSLDGSYNGKIRDIVKQAKANNATIKVMGFASSRTRNTDVVSHKLANFKVSADRAESVAKALKKAGLPAQKIEVEALSDTAPMYVEVMPEGERLNRRAEVYISY